LVAAAPRDAVTPLRLKRRNAVPEDQLAKLLRDVPEIDIDTVKGTSARLLAQGKDKNEAVADIMLNLFPKRADLSGLPVQNGEDCQTDGRSARQVQIFASAVKRAVLLTKGSDPAAKNSSMHAVYLQNAVLNSGGYLHREDSDNGSTGPRLKDEARAALVQLL